MGSRALRYLDNPRLYKPGPEDEYTRRGREWAKREMNPFFEGHRIATQVVKGKVIPMQHRTWGFKRHGRWACVEKGAIQVWMAAQKEGPPSIPDRKRRIEKEAVRPRMGRR